MVFFLVTISLLFSPAVGSNALSMEGEAVDKDADVYYVTRMGDRFMGFMSKHQEAVNTFAHQEQERLKSAMLKASSAQDKSLLETTVRVTEENRLEAHNAFSEMRNFVTTLKQVMGAVGSAARCQDLSCGAHAHCILDRVMGARCVCKDGYQGNGFVCKTQTEFAVHPLLDFRSGQARPEVADIHVSTLEGDTIVAVYRDVAKAQKGYALLGHATADSMRWHAPVLFSEQSQAFHPVVVQLQEGKGSRGGIAIAYRDKDRGGNGMLLGGRINPMTGEITLGTAKAFARHQAQSVAMLPLSDSRVAVVFAEHLLNNKNESDSQGLQGAAMYGATLLAQIHSDGKPFEVINKDHFASGPVARISATALSPTSFAIAYRLGQAGPDAKQAEASCILGQVGRNHVSFNAPSVSLEPDQGDIWSRSLSSIGENLLAYTYHSGSEKATKQAILRADPRTHRLDIVQGPEVLEHGFAPAVGSVAIVPAVEELEEHKKRPMSLTQRSLQQSTRLLTYISHDVPKPAQARLCGISESGVPSQCQSFAFSGREVASVAGTPLSDGRFIFLFTDQRGNPYYQFIGLMDPSI